MTSPPLPAVAVIVVLKVGWQTLARRAATPIDFRNLDGATHQRIKSESNSRKLLRRPCHLRPTKSAHPLDNRYRAWMASVSPSLFP